MKRNHGAEKFARELLELVKEHHAKPSLHNKTCFCYDCKVKRKEQELIESVERHNKFYRADGLPSMYSFACGNSARFENDNGRISLSKDGLWHVKGFINEQHVWESFDKFVDAKNYYKDKIKQLKK